MAGYRCLQLPPTFYYNFSGMLVDFAVYQSRLTKQYYFSASALGNLHSLIRSPYTAAAKYAGRHLPRKTSRRWADGATVTQYMTVGLLVAYTRSLTVGPGDTAIKITIHPRRTSKDSNINIMQYVLLHL